MKILEKIRQVRTANLSRSVNRAGVEEIHSLAAFRRIVRFILIASLLTAGYWLFIASDRYVSEASVIVQRTDQVLGAPTDISMLVGSVGGPGRTDQFLLREYLLSVDMLKKLDATLDLRAHYSGGGRDLISRLWLRHAPMEWFHRYFMSRVSIEYDDYAGVLRITAQAYDPKTAFAITSMMVREGEQYINQIGHQLAETQVLFLTTQVTLAQQRFQDASNALLAYQNKKGMVSAQTTVENISQIIANLESQRSEMQTRLASLPDALDRDHPTIVMLKQSIKAIEQQIRDEKNKLAAPSGKTLNYAIEEFQRLQMEVQFTKDIYQTALTGLEKGRMDATRMLKQVSILQSPSLPEYATEPRRIYNALVTLLVGVLLAGIVKLLEGIVRDHVD
jgi:capsular polysaccharide transport system permease protein